MFDFANVSVNKSDTPIIAVQIARSDSIGAESILLTVTGGKEACEDYGLGKNFTGSGSGLEAWVNSGYETSARLVNFADGEATKTVSFAIENNPVAEWTRTMTLTLSGPSAGTVTGGTRTITIVDDNYPEATKLFDVTDVAYGATGDGVTDDTAAILAALAACQAAGGGIVYFPDGTYMIQKSAPGDAFVIPFPYSETYAVSFVGQSKTGAIIKRVADDEWERANERLFHTTSGVHAADCKPVAFLNMTIDGNLDSNMINGGVHPQSHLIMFGSSGPEPAVGRFENLLLKNNTADGISHTAETESKCYQIDADDVARGGIVHTSGATGTCYIRDFRGYGNNAASGYQCEDADGIAVSFDDVDIYGGIGLQCGVDSPATFVGNNVNLWPHQVTGLPSATALNGDDGGETSFTFTGGTWYLKRSSQLYYAGTEFNDVTYYLADDAGIGGNLFLPGTFGTPSRWTTGTGWTVSGNKASHTGATGNLVDTFYTPNGSTSYLITMVVDSISGGTITPYLGGVANAPISFPGTHVFSIYVGGTTTKFTLVAATDCVCEISSITMQIQTTDNYLTIGDMGNATLWTAGTGWSFDGMTAVHSGGAGDLVDTTLAITASRYYRLAVTVDSISGGTITPYIGGVAGTAISTTGEHVASIYSSATTKVTLVASEGCECVVSRVHVWKAIDPLGMWIYAPANQTAAGVQNNGTFATADNWTWGGNWAHSTDKAAHSSGASVDDLVNTQAVATVAGKCYYITGSLTITAGSVTPMIGGTAGTPLTATGTFHQWIVAGNTDGLTFRASADAVVSSLDTVYARLASTNQLALFDTCTFGHAVDNPPPSYWPTHIIYYNCRSNANQTGSKVKFLDCVFEDFDGIWDHSDTSSILGGGLEINGGTINCLTRLLNGYQQYLFDIYGTTAGGAAKLILKDFSLGAGTLFGYFSGADSGNVMEVSGVTLTRAQADIGGSAFSSWTITGDDTALRTITGSGSPSGAVDGLKNSDGSKYDVYFDSADGNQEYHCTGMPTTWTAA